jgi:hypothetical protein
MKKAMLALALAGCTMGLSACATDGYGYSYGASSIGWDQPYAYDGWYDGHYGPIYDGYWGSDNYFYYRGSASDRGFRRADRDHFLRNAPRQGYRGYDRFRQQRGEFRPQQGMTMPRFHGNPGGGWRGRRGN